MGVGVVVNEGERGAWICFVLVGGDVVYEMVVYSKIGWNCFALGMGWCGTAEVGEHTTSLPPASICISFSMLTVTKPPPVTMAQRSMEGARNP